VEFLIEKFGLEKMQAILRDLGEGKPINEVLVANTTDMKTLQGDFEAFAKGMADTMGTKALWEKPKRGADGSVEKDWAALHPDNYWVVMEKANDLLEEGKRTEAIPILQKAISLYPAQTGADSAYSSLASIYRLEKQTDKERELLIQWVKHDDEAAEGLLRLLELDEAVRLGEVRDRLWKAVGVGQAVSDEQHLQRSLGRGRKRRERVGSVRRAGECAEGQPQCCKSGANHELLLTGGPHGDGCYLVAVSGANGQGRSDDHGRKKAAKETLDHSDLHRHAEAGERLTRGELRGAARRRPPSETGERGASGGAIPAPE